MKTAIYGRVSTKNKKQDTENQFIVLREHCRLMGYTITKEYKDEESGGTGDRQAFQELFTDAGNGEFELVLFWSLDRFSREGVRATINYLQQLEDYNVKYKSFSEQYIDSAGIFKDVIISLLATLASQEKIRLKERVIAGLERAKLKGRIGGRPRLSEQLREQIAFLKNVGLSNRKIAQQLSLAPSTIGVYVNGLVQ